MSGYSILKTPILESAMLTPQAIKDQDFQIKFRGYDAIEVKAFLELLAEDFFELTEQNRIHSEEIESLRSDMEFLRQEKESLAAEVRLGRENAEGIQSQIDQGLKHKDEEISQLRVVAEEAEARAASQNDENFSLRNKVNELEARLAGDAGTSIMEKAEIEKLRSKIEVLEEQNKELKQQGLDFKTTILAAQKFADSLRRSSEEEAERLMEKARADVQRYRTEANAELARLPKEIEKLHQQRMKVREELRAMLQSYLEALEIFPDRELSEKEDDLSDLFQSILLPDGDSTALDDIANIDMDLS
jgi:DivIVA domain-containing protein